MDQRNGLEEIASSRRASADLPINSGGGGGNKHPPKRKSNKTTGRFFCILVLLSISALGAEIFLHEYNGFQEQSFNVDDSDEASNLNVMSEQHIAKLRKDQKQKDLLLAKEQHKRDVEGKAYKHTQSTKVESSLNAGEDEPPSRIDMIKILKNAGAKVDDVLRSKLPPVEDVEKLYGRGVKIVGLDRCEEFRSSIPADMADIGGAGMFNTGTNLLYSLLSRNCHMPQRSKKSKTGGIRWQVPWGKHPPATWRFGNIAGGDVKRNAIEIQNFTLPVATIKDPLTWMGSMCRHSYAANWRHKKEHCPNLVPNEIDRKMGVRGDTIEVRVRYNSTHITHHKTLVNLWNDYYKGYYEATFPRLIIRAEDMMYHTEEVISKICTCGGGVMRDDFKYILQSAKSGSAHSGSNGLVSTMVRYGNSTLRLDGMTEEDLAFAHRELDPELMKTFGYIMP
mmetsp:Transcript_14511/g.22366  ORF Transcript_14511/g.22366 Transcript_14511/m.22366 type:complete len:450 (+) Transcript_14511:155-1504(+)|eukprot:CAMPEP_0196805200 /NCGR_PEP_ID=MMETSP1362-20130617/4944_1 /TAXON_ID=163516 /ORGANISM="Leptocylindrus danicus, Strain CCMP1856" /LENGTH=449 /DNA_ID=CAMNT_0042177971 /DNA_START=142 /DNA_END=1491 /DNA_ORIENTATION=+